MGKGASEKALNSSGVLLLFIMYVRVEIPRRENLA